MYNDYIQNSDKIVGEFVLSNCRLPLQFIYQKVLNNLSNVSKSFEDISKITHSNNSHENSYSLDRRYYDTKSDDSDKEGRSIRNFRNV